MKRLFTVVLLCILMTLVVSAEESVDDQGNPNDPAVNERANACYDGGTWEGYCDTELEWIAGWYYIRLEAGIFTEEDIPSWLYWIIPQDPDEDTSPSIAPTGPTCQPFWSAFPNIYYVQFDNQTSDIETDGDPYWLNDPTCSGVTRPLIRWTIVYTTGGMRAATRMCGFTPIRQQSAEVFICVGA